MRDPVRSDPPSHTGVVTAGKDIGGRFGGDPDRDEPCFYNSLTRIPLGVAVTIEVLGPLALSVIVSSRRSAWLWALLALAGVALPSLTGVRVGRLDPVGLAFAAAAASWAGYILATARAANIWR